MRFLPVLGLLVCVASVRPARGEVTVTATCEQHKVSADGRDMKAFFDHPDVGAIVATRMEIVTPEYAEFTYVGGALRRSATTVPEARCAYVGSAEGAPKGGVILFTCGAQGPRVTITFANATSLRLTKAPGDVASFEGAYAGVLQTTENATDAARMGFNPDHLDDARVTNVTSVGALAVDEASLQDRASRRSLLALPESPAVIYFDYILVSDDRRYANYDGNEEAVKADTVEEMATVNAMYLIGDRFTPQVQFRIKSQIVWSEKPPQMNLTNVGTDLLSAANFGRHANPPDVSQLQDEFMLWIFETTYFNLTAYLASGPKGARGVFADFLVPTGSDAYQLAQGAAWHMLSGEFMFEHAQLGLLVGFTTVDSLCYGQDAALWRASCEGIFDFLDVNDRLSWKFIVNGIQATSGDQPVYCVPNRAAGITSTLNTPGHKFPGYILAHELGHDLGFKHVYNDGDDPGNVNGCMEEEPHNGSAVMGYQGTDGVITWSLCSVNKFNESYGGLDRFGNTVNGGKYSCADHGTVALDQTYNPAGAHFAEGQDGYLHHFDVTAFSDPMTQSPPPPRRSPPPPRQSPPPSPPTVPSPPPVAIPEGATVVVYTVNTATLTDEQRRVVSESTLRNANRFRVE